VRIVIIEDNESVAKGIAYVLQDTGHATDILHNGEEADVFLRDDGADLIILDVNLPGLDGLSIVRNMRTRGDSRPVLMLTARDATSDRIEGLDAGADDYLVKPFEMAELEARVRALARRKDVPVIKPIAVGTLSYDLNSREVHGPEGRIDLPRRELAVFETLSLSRGKIVSKSRVLDEVYGVGTDIEEKVVEVYVSRLRKRLKPFGVDIKVHRSLGYELQVLDG
jgi:two-component system OmpR family response regulator